MTGDQPSCDAPTRVVSAHVEAQVVSESTLVLAVAVAENYEHAEDSFVATLDGQPVPIEVIPGAHHGRLHCLRDVGRGRLVVDHRATITETATPLAGYPADWIRYIRPSRYCESDRLGPFARAQFAGLEGGDLVAAVSLWVGANIGYVPGSSRPIDGAVATMLAREGVCRDFAHLTAALLRANAVAARIVAVYAPGLSLMDFHAVTEAWIDGHWYVLDPTGMAPRQSMVRIATGADAADIAFLTNVDGFLDLADMWVTALACPDLPYDDHTQLVQIR